MNELMTKLDFFQIFICVYALIPMIAQLLMNQIIEGLISTEFQDESQFSVILQFISFLLLFISQKMNVFSKKSSTVNIKATAHPAKSLKKSKSTQHIMPKKATKKTLQRNGSVENSHSYYLAKEKSVKSLKGKPKGKAKSEHSTKKFKPKKLQDSKTLKKNNHLQSQEGSSIVTITDDFQTKHMATQYFIYCNNKIPIENSAQRRLVYKIQMIDFENRTTLDHFNKNRLQSIEVGTDKIQLKGIAVGQKIQCKNCQIQTQATKIQQKKFQETIQKCFVDVLTELQILYLHKDFNFQPFTQNQRKHYADVLEKLAQKMLTGNKNVVNTNSLTDDQITVLLYQREGIQVGAFENTPQNGCPTHLLSILAYLKNLFCYIEDQHKQEILANLRMFYGLNYNQRISRLSKRLPHIKNSRPVLSEQIFEVFEYQMFKDNEFISQFVKQALHHHNKAIFDAVNSELQTFRPFYTSQGEPFPWTNNLGMTHYDITEQALSVIFAQIRQKIQKQVITLCGMHLDFDDEHLPEPHSSNLYRKKMQEKQAKMNNQSAKEYDDKVDLDYIDSGLKFEAADQIFYQLINQLELQFFLSEEEIENNFDFQYYN